MSSFNLFYYNETKGKEMDSPYSETQMTCQMKTTALELHVNVKKSTSLRELKCSIRAQHHDLLCFIKAT